MVQKAKQKIARGFRNYCVLMQSSESFEFHEAEILQELSRLRNDLEHVIRGLPKVPVSDEGFRGKWEWVFVVTN